MYLKQDAYSYIDRSTVNIGSTDLRVGYTNPSVVYRQQVISLRRSIVASSSARTEQTNDQLVRIITAYNIVNKFGNQ